MTADRKRSTGPPPSAGVLARYTQAYAREVGGPPPGSIGTSSRRYYTDAGSSPRARLSPDQSSQNGTDRGRNTARKDNEYFSLDWRLARAFRLANGVELLPTIEMFNTFNNANNINPLTTPALFNFDGFLRTGVGDPRQMQVSVKLVF